MLHLVCSTAAYGSESTSVRRNKDATSVAAA